VAPDIWLSGFSEAIWHPTGRVPVTEPIDWIRRGPLGYQPQPYEQLANCYRHAGHDDDVRRVLLAKQRQRRTALSAPGQAAGRLLDATVGYGYRPWPAAIWLAVLLTAGALSTPSTVRMPCPAGQCRHSKPSPTPRPAHPHRRIRAPQRLPIRRPGPIAGRRPDRRRVDTRHRRHRMRHPHHAPRLTNHGRVHASPGPRSIGVPTTLIQVAPSTAR